MIKGHAPEIVTILILSLIPLQSYALGPSRPAVSPYEISAPVTQPNRVDELVFSHLTKLTPSYLCSDEVFIRRAYLDLTGTLPTSSEVRTFLGGDAGSSAGQSLSPGPKKRQELIEHLLASEEYVSYQALKWCDLLRVKSEFPINLWPNAVQAYYRWISTAVRTNMPYDRFVRELLTASGSNFREPQINFYRAIQKKEPRMIAQAVALTFMGARANLWPREQLDALACFFSKIGYKSTAEWKEEIVFYDPDALLPRTTDHRPIQPVFPDGNKASFDPALDPRAQFADWLVAPANPWFNRAIANRLWFWCMGHGIVNPPDDIRPDNLPENPELLAYLEKELISHKYDLKHIYRLILNSQAYQLSSIPGDAAGANNEHCSRYQVRRMEAEVLIDALDQISGTSESYFSSIPEPFTFIPEKQRTIDLPDGSITSPFLELYGRPARDTGYESERNNTPSTAQKLHLLNSSHIQNKIRNSKKLRQLLNQAKTPQNKIEELYLCILSRYPTDEERNISLEYVQSKERKMADGFVDLGWSLINSNEFILKH